MKFRTLSIAEQDYQSDRITGVQNNSRGAELSVSVKYEQGPRLTIRQADGSLRLADPVEVSFKEVDLDGLIDLLCEARTFIREEEMVEKLKG